MRIGIEAQRIFRRNKHGMDYVVLQEIKELQKMETSHEFYVFVKPGEDHCVENSKNVHIIELHCPSYPLWEQWALPRAAKRYGIELLHCTSDTSSMPEIAGNDAILINPENTDEITDAMLRLETDKAFYQKQKEIGLERAKLFSWRKTAEQLLKLYEEVGKELGK